MPYPAVHSTISIGVRFVPEVPPIVPRKPEIDFINANCVSFDFKCKVKFLYNRLEKTPFFDFSINFGVHKTDFLKNTSDNSPWFATWFDSNYYHLLYDHRDEEEAARFILRLLGALNPSQSSKMLDLGCGKGRHSRILSEKGHEVTGVDLSTASIEHARTFEKENLSFFTHDMREPYRINYFDYIFLFFTSFGYFETEREHIKTLRNIGKGLTSNGKIVLDFFNANSVIKNLKAEDEVVIKKGISFKVYRTIKDSYVIKTIQVQDGDANYEFFEKVRLISLQDFEHWTDKIGLKIIKTYGDYELNDYDPVHSKRLILEISK